MQSSNKEIIEKQDYRERLIPEILKAAKKYQLNIIKIEYFL